MNRIDKIKAMLLDDKEEMRKCEESPVYFYNKYIRRKGDIKFTEEEYADWQKQAKRLMDGVPLLKIRSHYKDRPLLPKDCYKQITKQKTK